MASLRDLIIQYETEIRYRPDSAIVEFRGPHAPVFMGPRGILQPQCAYCGRERVGSDTSCASCGAPGRALDYRRVWRAVRGPEDVVAALHELGGYKKKT